MVDPWAESRSLQELLLGMPQEQSCQSLMEMVVGRLAAKKHVALAIASGREACFPFRGR